ncbi:MAG: diguanylate cyclase (GGDEF)-like protein [Alphaproteobacteria bacterium]|jgi:diguanylate cyclase (GGDEF)-like protein
MPKDEIIGELSEHELRELVPQLQSLTDKYKRSERIQKALYNISELASSLDNFESLYAEIHDIVSSFMLADNFFVAFYEVNEGRIQFEYFVDERDEETVQTISYDKIKNGVTAHILRSGETLALTKENFLELQATHNFEILGTPPVDLMGVPIIRDNQVIGTMVVQSYNDNIRYDADDLEILIFISQHIVSARDRITHRDFTETLIAERTEQLVNANHTLEAEISERKRVEQLQKALFEISELSTKVDDDIIDFYTKLHGTLKQLINAENCYIALLDKTEENLSFPYFVGRDEEFNSTRQLTRGLTEYVIRSKEAVLINSAKICELVDSNEIGRKFVVRMLNEGNSWMGATLEVDGIVKGVIALQTYGLGDDYDDDDLDILRFVSQHISVAMERRKAANKLIEYNQQLSEKVQERTAELNETNESLKKQIEQRKEVELKLIHDAHHDGLTNLPNRVMFNSRLNLAIASKQRYSDHNFALLFIDLDRFKTINDTLGHHAGDEFLIEASKRIDACKRSHDLLARLGGDEFVILIDKFTNMSDVENVAQRIVDSISASFVIEDKEVFSGASIGVAEITSDYTEADDVLRDADAAMYQAKNLGRNRYIIFDISMRNQLIEEIDDERTFRKAYKAGEFEYAIQPIKDLHDNSTLFYECTINWPQHPKYAGTENFWTLADKCGLTYTINKQLMEETFRILHTWRIYPDYKNTKIGLSLSIEHLLHKSSFEDLVHQIETSEITSELLVIELSELALTRFTKYLPNMLNKLQSLGVTLVLDNFGSHSGSLNHLFKYDFDYIKLNPNLVNTFGMSDKYHRLVNSIVLIANEMSIGVIADGIDDEMILQELNEIGCHFGQGNVITPPAKI